MEKEPTIRIGITERMEITPLFHGEFIRQSLEPDGSIHGEGILYIPQNLAEPFFTLPDVTIGVGFHWEREERQSFRGSLELRRTPGGVTAINVVPVEEYLKSVISSEMSSGASLEFLKAHAVISRSWVMRRIGKSCIGKGPKPAVDGNKATARTETPECIIRWYDQDRHKGYDVCADDHCQRYQGITRIGTGKAVEAVELTRGEVLAYGAEICDARFSKCCGGMMETFGTCWDDTPHPYLQSKPDPYCALATPDDLRQVLNSYDLETPDYYRWKVSYTTAELSELVRKKSGIDFGEILELTPLERGGSGRIRLLRIRGTRRTVEVGKELEIRKWLSPSHLYSSAFEVEKSADSFTFHGSGWGHGVGLCQIGAAVMATKGFSYREILRHYYPSARLHPLDY